MPSWVLYVICAIVIIVQGLAIDATTLNNATASPQNFSIDENMKNLVSLSWIDPSFEGPRIMTPDTSLINDGQVAKIAYKEIKISDLKEKINAAIEPSNPLVHDESLLMVAKFSEPGDSAIKQICSIYSYLKNGDRPIKGWIYAPDPRGSEYFNYANESIRIGDKSGCTGAGDCDDFAILMASLVESIGGTTRIILAFNNSTGGHAYAEVYLGNLNDQDDQVNDIIDWLKKEYSTMIFLHIMIVIQETYLAELRLGNR